MLSRIRRARSSAVITVALASGLLLGQAVPANAALGPATWQFPGGCAGQSTLQGCINIALNGDTIEIVTNTAIVESPTITKSLTLDSGTGFHGSITGHLQITGTTGALDVAIHDLSFDGGIQVDLNGGVGHVITLRHLTVTNGTLPNASGLRFVTQVPATLDAASNVFNVLHGMAPQIYLEAENDAGTATFHVVGNRMDGHGADNSFGGVQLILDGSGGVRADILNNAIWDVGGCGCVGGAGVYYRVNEPGSYDVNVVGNTFEHAVFGVNVQTITTAGGTYSLDLFNNIVAHPLAQGVNIDSFQDPAEFKLRAGNNDYYALGQPNNFNGYSGGTGNLAVAPQYRAPSTGDLRLKSTSPLLNKGVVCSPGGIAGIDAAGNFRLAGSSVDLGAYERAAGLPTGIVFVGSSTGEAKSGTAGADILCGNGGNDTLRGKGGDDFIDGGSGADTLVGGSGADRLLGGSGADVLCAIDGTHGNDHLDGGPGSDGYRADSGDPRVNVEHLGAC